MGWAFLGWAFISWIWFAAGSFQMGQFAKDLEAGVDFFPSEGLQALGAKAFNGERSHHPAVEKRSVQHFAVQLCLRSDVSHESTGKGIARSSRIFHFLNGQSGCAERMVADAKCAFAKENRGAVFPMLDDQRLRSQSEDFVGGAKQVRFTSKHFGFTIVDQQHVDQ